MWDSNVQPTASFEDAARVLGVNRARRLWAYYDVAWKRKEQEADAIEAALAKQAERKNYVWNETIGGEPVARMAPHTYLKLWRASLPQKGCTGGEYLEDEDYMRYFLKKNEACRVKVRSPKIQGGWSPALELAKFEGQQARKREAAMRAGIVTGREAA